MSGNVLVSILLMRVCVGLQCCGSPETGRGNVPWDYGRTVITHKTCRCELQAFLPKYGRTQQHDQHTHMLMCVHMKNSSTTDICPPAPFLYTHSHTSFCLADYRFICCHFNLSVCFLHLKFPPGHKVLHSAKDFHRRSLSMGQPAADRGAQNIRKLYVVELCAATYRVDFYSFVVKLFDVFTVLMLS